jgi:hypothetical protein
LNFPNEVGQQQRLFSAEPISRHEKKEHLNRGKDQEHELTRKISKVAYFRKLQLPPHVGGNTETCSRLMKICP